MELVFQGLDYEAAVYADHILLGEHKGMFEPAVFDVTELLSVRENLVISVLLKQAPDEMGQIGKTSATFTQKSRFNYKWDFSTRLVNAGIWDDVLLRIHEDCSWGEMSITTHAEFEEDGSTKATGSIEIQAAVLSMTGAEPARKLMAQITCADPVGNQLLMQTHPVCAGTLLKTILDVPEPELWYPNGYGAQPLYSLELKLLDEDGKPLDTRVIRTGIRRLEYIRNVDSPDNALPYTVVINGRRIYMKGVNMTPLDHLYGNVSVEQYQLMVRLMKAAHVNLVRVWGGGIIEKEVFYDLCDANGIMVWQEFIQSSSGIDNIPSKRPEFLELLHRSARSALCVKRNHVALTIWSGGNELMSEPNKPSDISDSNLAMLMELVGQNDPQRLFLPTSASGPVEYITETKGQGHDVHGHWKYMGNPYHYELYGSNDNLLHSEFGADGLSSLKSLEKFLGTDNRQPVSMENSAVWRHHGEWWDTLSRDEEIFGSLTDLAQFSACSQWIQAEGIRFVLEANRRRKFRNSGSIVWQLNEPWPNVSCTNLVDYYGEPKMAYHWMKMAFRPLHVSLDYRSLLLTPGTAFHGDVYIHGWEGGKLEAEAVVLDAAGRCLHRQRFVTRGDRDRAVCAGSLNFTVPEQEDRLYFIRLTLVNGEAEPQQNIYLFSTARQHLYAPALSLAGGNLQVRQENRWLPTDSGELSLQACFTVLNIGSEVLLHVHAQEEGNRYWMEAEEQFLTLFPGEARTVSVICTPKQAGGFLAGENHSISDDLPNVQFHSFLSAQGTSILEGGHKNHG